MSASAPQIADPATKRSRALDCVEMLGDLTALFEERRAQLAAGAGLSVQQWHALEEVSSEQFMPSLFAKRRASSAAAVSKILRQLTDKGLVEAHVSSTDARVRQYRLTAPGKKRLAEVRAQRQRALDEVWMRLSGEELEQFLSAGRAVTQRLGRWTEGQRRQQEKKEKSHG